MNQIPNLDYSSRAAIKFLIISDLKKTNASNDTITINYNNLDPDSKREIKEILYNRISYWLDKKSYLDPEVGEYLTKLFKANQSNAITIEYSKLVDPGEDDRVFEIVHKSYTEKVSVSQDIRAALQLVLVKRSSKLYNNMVLNPTI